MATTTNFGWETPDDTDLVKDGALAIRTLGSAIDTSLVDLKGGTTGQVLSKTSNTDMDFTWVTSDDANAIQNAIVDAKGDLITATAADTPARLAVGTNGQVLTADSTTATGLKWASASSTPTFVGCVLTNSAAQTVANATNTLLLFNTERIDTDGFHSTTTNTGRITIPSGKAGKYLITCRSASQTSASGYRTHYTAKNGLVQDYFQFPASNVDINGASSSTILDLAVGDYIEFYFRQNSTGSISVYGDNSDTGLTQFSAFLLGA